MNFPRYWAKAAQTVNDAKGEPYALVAWGSSDEGTISAEAAARSRLARMAEKVARAGFEALGRYGYGERALREPVLQALPGAAVTRNSYGCEVLNTERLMFVDIDLAEPYRPGLIERWLGRKATDPEGEALARVEGWLARNRDWGFRVYRTKSGLRLMAAHAPVEAADGDSVMSALGADPLYLRLCRAQKSYRARLTPKPWRCGLRAPGVEWPFADLRAEGRFREWQREYDEKSPRFATCRFVRVLGNTSVDAKLEPLLALHDERTRARSELALA